MRFWLAAFVVLFAAIELLDWVAQIGSWQPTGVWLVLGGMGLAAISNLSKISSHAVSADAEETTEPVKDSETGKTITATAQQTAPSVYQQTTEQDDKNSISFKVRPLKR